MAPPPSRAELRPPFLALFLHVPPSNPPPPAVYITPSINPQKLHPTLQNPSHHQWRPPAAEAQPTVTIFSRRHNALRTSGICTVGPSSAARVPNLGALCFPPLREPLRPDLRIVSAAMAAGDAAAVCNITFLLTNPNRRLRAIYSRIEISLFYPPQQVLLSEVHRPPLAQATRSQISIETDLSFNGGTLRIELAESIKQHKSLRLLKLQGRYCIGTFV
ncbi:late embryogenesis abundant protein [Striga asiatica]|uniref:Late embryogenesis abundant protein n=1 Tax=Striga asiatica TaxID=4170 RepID=A0A5A7QEF8_STRAF|nr:late embryogenesis abundant protein [Striga asiatica]